MRLVTKLRVLGFSTFLLSGCAHDQASSSELSFPIEYGDAEMGREAFMDLGCTFCHSVEGVQLDLHPMAFSAYINFELGKSGSGSRSIEQLLTAIVDPDHYLAETYRQSLGTDADVPSASPMPRMEEMTLGQLYDLIAFLNQEYD